MQERKLKLIMRSLKRERFFPIAFITLGIISISSFAVYVLETEPESTIRSAWDGLWWAFVTICTVGYGDKYPVTVGGKIIGIFLMLSGIGLLSMMTATVASVLVEHKLKEGKGLEGVKEKGHILVCGWNDHTENVVSGILKSNPGASIFLISDFRQDELESLGFKYEGKNVHLLRGDFINEEMLLKANVKKALSVVIMADLSGHKTEEGADNRTILAALAVKSLAPHVRTVAELLDSENIYHLKRAKVDDVIVRGGSAGALLAGAVENPGLPDIMAEMLAGPEGVRLKRKKIPDHFTGRRFGEYADHEKRANGIIVLGITQEKKTVVIEDILSDDTSMIDRFIREKLRESGKGVLDNEQQGRIMLNPKDDQIITADCYAIVIK